MRSEVKEGTGFLRTHAGATLCFAPPVVKYICVREKSKKTVRRRARTRRGFPRITNKPANKNLILRLCAQALGHYRKAVASEPENVEALFCKAVVSAQLMELFDALKVGRCCSRCRRCSR